MQNIEGVPLVSKGADQSGSINQIAEKVVERLGSILKLSTPEAQTTFAKTSQEKKLELINDLIREETLNSQNFKKQSDLHAQTNLNEFLTQEQIDRLKEDGISVTESELKKLHQEVLQEQGISPDELVNSGTFEDKLFGRKPNTASIGKYNISTGNLSKLTLGDTKKDSKTQKPSVQPIFNRKVK